MTIHDDSSEASASVESVATGDVMERALVAALEAATAAVGRGEQGAAEALRLALAELQAHRRATAGVVDLGAERARRGQR